MTGEQLAQFLLSDPAAAQLPVFFVDRMGGFSQHIPVGSVVIDQPRGRIVIADVSNKQAKKRAARWPI